MGMIDDTKLIIASLMHDEDYARRVLPHLDTQYFNEPEYQWFVQTYHTYFDAHNDVPPREAIEVELSTNDSLSQGGIDNLTAVLNEIDQPGWTKAVSKASDDWLTSRAEKWCRDRALYNAVRKSIDAIQSTNDRPPEWMPQMFEQALAVSFEGTKTHDFFENADQRFAFYHETLHRVPMMLPSINKTLKGGGMPRKSLGVIVAPTGVGKTMALTQQAAHSLMEGYNVLYITLEIAEEYIAERVETTLFDMGVDEVEMLEYKKYRSKIDQLKTQTHGRLKVREFPPSSISSTHIHTFLSDLRTKDDFEPQVIMVDYLNLMSTGRETKGDNSYSKNKKVAEDLRAIAVRQNALMLTATQTNREGQNASDYELNQVSESHGVAATSDWVGALISTDQLEEMNQMTFKQLKNRFGSLQPRAWRIGMQRHKFKLYDIDDISGAIEQDQGGDDDHGQGLGMII